MNHSRATFNKIWSNSYVFQIKARITCKCIEGGPSTIVLGHLSESLPQAPKFQFPSLSVKLEFQPLSTIKQKPRNRLDVENDIRLVLTNTPPKMSGLVAQIQAQSSHWLASMLFVLYKNVNTVNLTCEMIVFFYHVGCYVNNFRVAGNAGQTLT